MTEEEAKTKWCPQTIHTPDTSRNCRGSECMAWRWFMGHSFGGAYEQDGSLFWGKNTPIGYCGLAGKP